ncbi:MAG: ribonuclease HII [Anaerovoracaceae bacterium]
MQRLLEMTKYENLEYAKGGQFIAGVDEVGRGPLAGPVVAAAVVLPQDFQVIGIDDSKKLSEKKREYFSAVIKEEAIAYGVGLVDHERIDQINILEATKEAMIQAVTQVENKLEEKYGKGLDHILFDALRIKKIETPQTGIIKGDSKSVSIAAASIIAKVTRDHIMIEFSEKYPYYSFETNKGYGTKAHYQGIYTHGICPIHRRSFLKNLDK